MSTGHTAQWSHSKPVAMKNGNVRYFDVGGFSGYSFAPFPEERVLPYISFF